MKMKSNENESNNLGNNEMAEEMKYRKSISIIENNNNIRNNEKKNEMCEIERKCREHRSGNEMK
jgi:hypothetical protein